MRLQPATYRRITIGAMLALCTIIVTGAGVRLSGSGLGCDSWPACNDYRFIDVSNFHMAIEQLNRLFTGVIVVLVAAAVLGSLFRAPRRRDLTLLSLGLVAGVFGQAVVGGIVVLTQLHPAAVQQHFLLSMVTVVNAMALVKRAGEPDGVPRRHVVRDSTRRLVWLLAVLCSVAIFTGTLVTGAGPHAGDENARRFDFDISNIARIHGISVVITLTAALALIAWTRGHRADRQAIWPILTTWMFLATMQAAIGYVQYFNGVPELLVALHIALATALYAVTVLVVLATKRPIPDPISPSAFDRATDEAQAPELEVAGASPRPGVVTDD